MKVGCMTTGSLLRFSAVTTNANKVVVLDNY